MSTKLKTKKALFIIESLEYEDEKTRREGRILQQVMRLSGADVKYIYIRTQQELGFALEQFRKSKYRYLHISCHGDRHSIAFTLDKTVPFEDLAAEIRPYLKGRRLFFSACSVVNDELATAILPKSGCYSIVGPRNRINFDDALLMWASFYHLAFRDNDDGLRGGKIRWMLRRIRHTFGIEFDYYRSDGGSYKKDDIDVK
jgi:hypothetical protein